MNTQSNKDTLLLIYQRKKKINLTVNKDMSFIWLL